MKKTVSARKNLFLEKETKRKLKRRRIEKKRKKREKRKKGKKGEKEKKRKREQMTIGNSVKSFEIRKI